ncbi:MAG: glycine cleavage system protein R [Solirubrobacterales bacterium]
MSHFAVTAVGRDRPGIVADISHVLLDVGGNIEDSKMSILRGHFAVMLIVAGPSVLDREEVEARLAPLKQKLELDAITVSNVAQLHHGELDSRPTHVISVYGADHPGIVHTISRRLADGGISITDLETKLIGEKGQPIYVMLMEARVPADADATELASDLERVGRETGLEVSLSQLDDDPL